jgi:hypothetical protein
MNDHSKRVSWFYALALVVFLAFLLPALWPYLFPEPRRSRPPTITQLKELVIAMYGYNEEHGHLPPAALAGPDGQPLLSWRVLLLPHLGQEDLYREFRLDEPWDSPHNVRLLPRMPPVYANARKVGPKAQPYHTFFQVFVGKGTPFEARAEGVKLPDDFPDGTFDTILIVQGGQAVPWTKPEDIPYAGDQPVDNPGKIWPSAFCVGMADGSTRTVSNETSEATLRALITRDGGEVVEDF